MDENLQEQLKLQQDRYLKYLNDIYEDAVGYLKSRHLPTAPWIKHETESGSYETRLPYYLEEYSGKKISNVDYCAAELVTLFENLDTVDPSIRESLIIKICQVQTALVINRAESVDNSERAARSRKRSWAVALAKELVTRHDNFPDAWRALRRRAREGGSVLGEYAGHDVELDLDADALSAEDGKIKKESFRTGPFKTAKAELKNL